MGKVRDWGPYLAEYIKSMQPGTVFTVNDLWRVVRDGGAKGVTTPQVASWVGRRIQGSRFGFTQQEEYKDLDGIQSTGHVFEFRWMPGQGSYGMHQRAEMERLRKLERVQREEAEAQQVREQETARAAMIAEAKREEEGKVQVRDQVQEARDVVGSLPPPPPPPLVSTNGQTPGSTVIIGRTAEGVLVTMEDGELVLYQKVRK